MSTTNTCSQRTREKYLMSREREERQRKQNKITGEIKRKEEKTHECTEEEGLSGHIGAKTWRVGGWRIDSSPVTEPPQSCHHSQHPPLTVCWDELWSAGWPWLGHYCKNKYTIFFSIVLISYIYTYFGSGGLMSAIVCLVQGVSAGTGSGLRYFQVLGLLGICGHVGACHWLLNLVTRFITQWF